MSRHIENVFWILIEIEKKTVFTIEFSSMKHVVFTRHLSVFVEIFETVQFYRFFSFLVLLVSAVTVLIRFICGLMDAFVPKCLFLFIKSIDAHNEIRGFSFCLADRRLKRIFFFVFICSSLWCGIWKRMWENQFLIGCSTSTEKLSFIIIDCSTISWE